MSADPKTKQPTPTFGHSEPEREEGRPARYRSHFRRKATGLDATARDIATNPVPATEPDGYTRPLPPPPPLPTRGRATTRQTPNDATTRGFLEAYDVISPMEQTPPDDPVSGGFSKTDLFAMVLLGGLVACMLGLLTMKTLGY